jgi:hypothetical protein
MTIDSSPNLFLLACLAFLLLSTECPVSQNDKIYGCNDGKNSPQERVPPVLCGDLAEAYGNVEDEHGKNDIMEWLHGESLIK